MNLRLLQSYWLFYLVVKEGSFTKAAGVASMCQPPLSMHIKKLEESLGVKLFERANKKAVLTKEGQAIFPVVEKFLAKTEIFFDQVQTNLDGMEKKVTFGSFAWLLQLFIAPMLNELKIADPRKRYDFIEVESIDLVSQLQDFKIDVGYAYAEPFERAGIAAVPIAQIENKVVVPKNHFLAEFDSIHLEQLSRLNCICLPSDVSPQLFSFMKQLSAQYHFNILSRTDIRNFYNQVAFVESQHAFAIVATPACDLISKNLKAIPIVNTPCLTLVRMTREDVSQRLRNRLKEREEAHIRKIPGIRTMSGTD